jgi:lipoprotein-anchoring transpeptidase ErfK/SrfK
MIEHLFPRAIARKFTLPRSGAAWLLVWCLWVCLPEPCLAVEPAGETAEAEVVEEAPLYEEPAADFSALLRPVGKPKITPRVLQRATPEATNIYISLTQQKAYLFVGNEVAIETPISSGRRAAMTPHGSFSIVEKTEKMQSNTHGDFVDKQGRVVRRGVSAKLDSAPSGTTFRPQPMRYFLRLNWTGLGLHAGHLPGYPASQVHVRFPEEIARLIFEHTQVGTPVVIGD